MILLKRTLSFLRTPPMVETNSPQRNRKKHSEEIGVRLQRNLCFYPETVQFDKWPEIVITHYIIHVAYWLLSFYLIKFWPSTILCNKWKLQTYITSIMTNGEARTREFRLAESFMVLKCLIELLCKSFMCWPWKHATEYI